MSDSQTLYTSLLRPAIIHILRAAGFHSTRPSVLDTLTDLCARYLLLLGQRTAYFAYQRTSLDSDTNETDTADRAGEEDTPAALSNLDTQIPTLSDIRLALTASAFFPSAICASEEAWRESLRKPLHLYPASAREKERQRRDAEDTRDVHEFMEWVTGAANQEIRRVAGVLATEGDEATAAAVAAATAAAKDVSGSGGAPASGLRTSQPPQPPTAVGADGDSDAAKAAAAAATAVVAAGGPAHKDDYLNALKKKHSKTGDEARYAGTALGKLSDDRAGFRIEGGPESLDVWMREVKRRRVVTEDATTED